MCLLGLKQQRLIWAKCSVFLGFYIYTWHCIFIHRTYSFPVGQKSDGSKGLLKEDLIIICIDKRYIADEVIAGWLDSAAHWLYIRIGQLVGPMTSSTTQWLRWQHSAIIKDEYILAMMLLCPELRKVITIYVFLSPFSLRCCASCSLV